MLWCGVRYVQPPPQKKIGEEIPTNRRTGFSAKQVPSALDLSPRPKTDLPFGCSVVGVTWKPEICLNVRKKNSSIGLYMVPEDEHGSVRQWSSGICRGLQIDWQWIKSSSEFFFLHFLSLVLMAAVEYSATDAEGSTTPDSTDSAAKDVATPDTTRGAEGTCSPESIHWGADDEVL